MSGRTWNRLRLAIEECDALAWERIYQQWRGLLRNPAADLALEQAPVESYITAAQSKFWQAMARSQRPRQGFSTLSGALAYLQSCLNSVVLDAVRQAHARQGEVGEHTLAEGVGKHQPAERDAALWEYIERALPDRRERALVYLRYVLGYWPREIVATYPQEFTDVGEIYRMERNILHQLSWHPALAGWKA